MGRVKLVIKKLEGKSRRKVTFSKRFPGLLKKAYELSVLTDSDVVVVIRDPTNGKLRHFSYPKRPEDVLIRFLNMPDDEKKVKDVNGQETRIVIPNKDSLIAKLQDLKILDMEEEEKIRIQQGNSKPQTSDNDSKMIQHTEVINYQNKVFRQQLEDFKRFYETASPTTSEQSFDDHQETLNIMLSHIEQRKILLQQQQQYILMQTNACFVKNQLQQVQEIAMHGQQGLAAGLMSPRLHYNTGMPYTQPFSPTYSAPPQSVPGSYQTTTNPLPSDSHPRLHNPARSPTSSPHISHCMANVPAPSPGICQKIPSPPFPPQSIDKLPGHIQQFLHGMDLYDSVPGPASYEHCRWDYAQPTFSIGSNVIDCAGPSTVTQQLARSCAIKPITDFQAAHTSGLNCAVAGNLSQHFNHRSNSPLVTVQIQQPTNRQYLNNSQLFTVPVQQAANQQDLDVISQLHNTNKRLWAASHESPPPMLSPSTIQGSTYHTTGPPHSFHQKSSGDGANQYYQNRTGH